MKKLIRMLSFLIIPVILMTQTASALAATFAAAPAPTKVTIFKPETMEAEPLKTVEADSGSSWWKWTLGVLVVGAAAAAASPKSEESPPGPNGNSSNTTTGGGGSNTGIGVAW